MPRKKDGTRRGTTPKGEVGPTFTPTEREAVKAKVAELDRKGYTQESIARVVGVTGPMVCHYLKQIRKLYQSHQIASRDEAVLIKLEQLAAVREEAYEAWERSKRDAIKTVQEGVVPPPPKEKPEKLGKAGKNQPAAPPQDSPLRTVKVTRTVEGRDPNAAFMGIIIKTYQAELELLGLAAPKKSETKNLNVGVDWNAISDPTFVQRLKESGLTDEVEDRLEEERKKLLPPPPNGRHGSH